MNNKFHAFIECYSKRRNNESYC